MLIPLERVGDLSFPDRPIEGFSYDGDILHFVSDGVFVDGGGLTDQQTSVECVSSGIALSRNFIDNEWVEADPREGGLNFIGEWTINKERLRLAGFDAQSGEWREYQIPVSSVSIKTGVGTNLLSIAS